MKRLFLENRRRRLLPQVTSRSTRVTAHVEFGVMRLIFGVLFDADHGTENHFSIGGLGEARWILSALPGPHRQSSRNAIFERPPKFT